ncbi:MAG TPA: hypothetical protein PK413_11385, partial [Thermoanaerobaculia bacterium]|nr:hypothetical protein [Thermoanaerobaculia bacterium]
MAPPVPTPAAPAAVPAKAAPRPPAGAKKKRWVAVLAAIAAFLMLALGVVWLARGLSREQPPRPSLAPAPKLVTSSPSAASATGRLVIDAVPWGEVVALRDASGRSQALPSERRTPLILALPPGQYVAEVSNPGASTPGRCMTEVVDGKESLCTVQVLSLKAEDYFDVAGWWR